MAWSVTGRFIKKDGQLIPEDVSSKFRYNDFVNRMPDGAVVEFYLDMAGNAKSSGQLARVHAMIRELSVYAGYTFDEMKKEVKTQAGLSVGKMYKSFTDCSTDELNLAIQAAKVIGDNINCPVQ